ncbi:MAG TPA: sensor histidine kinase [Firmicutes bacterium]|nr:sensor histidine kinase [Bacillota bacterium]
MKDFSLHLLDLAQNSLRAGATLISFFLNEQVRENLLVIEIKDNGKGMTRDELRKVVDPFFTTRTTRKVGLGVSLFAAAAQRCGGKLTISSTPDLGTRLTASFQLNHWDKPPLGDMASTLITLIAGNPEVDLVYRHQRGTAEYLFDTRGIKKQLKDVPICNPTVLTFLEEEIRTGLAQIENL